VTRERTSIHNPDTIPFVRKQREMQTKANSWKMNNNNNKRPPKVGRGGVVGKGMES
jgi:hypothetical protein